MYDISLIQNWTAARSFQEVSACCRNVSTRKHTYVHLSSRIPLDSPKIFHRGLRLPGMGRRSWPRDRNFARAFKFASKFRKFRRPERRGTFSFLRRKRNCIVAAYPTVFHARYATPNRVFRSRRELLFVSLCPCNCIVSSYVRVWFVSSSWRRIRAQNDHGRRNLPFRFASTERVPLYFVSLVYVDVIE